MCHSLNCASVELLSMYMNGCRKLRVNGKGEDRDKEDREHDESPSNLL